MPARLLILGASGMLGQALVSECRRRGIAAVGIARRAHAGVDLTLDVLDDAALVRAVGEIRPDAVINAAAQVNLAACEAQPGDAWLINGRLPAVLAALAIDQGFHLVQVSTDHYYAGAGARLHAESDPVLLLNEYARTKYAGEAGALTAPGAWVVRTNLVGFRGDAAQATFVEWALSSLAARQPVTLFDDYFTSSISVRLFAGLLLDALPLHPAGLCNLAGREAVSKRDFVLALARGARLETDLCRTGSVAALSGARRADSLGLDVRRAEALLGRPMPGLSDTIASLLTEFEERPSCATTAS